MSTSSHPPNRFSLAYAGLMVRRPGTVLLVILALLAGSVWAASKLRINSNQLDLISQELPEVKEVKRVIDMVGGSGYLMLALRGSDEATLKRVSDDLAAKLQADQQNVRFLTYKMPVEFVQENMVLFIKTEDLAEGKRRISAYMKDQLRRNNPFYIELKKTEPVKLDLQDLVDKYSSVGKKSIRDDYYISQDRKMLLLLIKPMWDTNEIGKTKTYVKKLNADLAEYSKANKAGENGATVALVEDYAKMGDKQTVAYGFTGSYKTAVDDSYAMEESLGPVAIYAFLSILLITIAFFRQWATPIPVVVGSMVLGAALLAGGAYLIVGKPTVMSMVNSVLGGILLGFSIDWFRRKRFPLTILVRWPIFCVLLEAANRWMGLGLSPADVILGGLVLAVGIDKWAPTFIVVSGMVIGTLITMGFTYVRFGELNMITSILGGILMGFGIDFGIHFMFRTRLELGAGKPYDVAIRDAIINAGRPALVSAVVTAGAFFVLMVSEFRGFSQFGFLAGCGTLILGFTLFAWSPALLALAGRINPALPERLIGTMVPPATNNVSGKEIRFPHPKLLLGVSSAIVVLVCAAAVPWNSGDAPSGKELGFFERLKYGVRFNYNTRALIPEGQPSVRLQDEINARFQISSDPLAVYTKTLEEAKEVYDELTKNPGKYKSIDQVVSIYTFVPPPEVAQANRKILDEWEEELKDIDVTALPPEMQEKAALFKKILAAKPFDVHGVPEIYAQQFRHLPTTSPENHGYLTFIYPSVDLWDGKLMLQFADETSLIKTASGKEFRAAGAAPLYARLARIVLADGKLTVLLVSLWILVMHFADFRSVPLALASVIPLTVGLAMMLGFMSLFDLRLNFMNIIILPILLGFGVSHGLYLLHRFLEGTSPVVALRSVGAAVASSTLTAVAGFAALLGASHNGLKSMGLVATIGLITTLVVSFTVLAAVMQLLHDQRVRKAAGNKPPSDGSAPGSPGTETRAA